MLSTKTWLAPLCGIVLTGCASASAFNSLVDVFTSGETAFVREGGASLQCGDNGDGLRVQTFPDGDALRQWEQTQGVTLLKKESGTGYRYAVLSMGSQPSAGYGIAVSRKALLDGDVLTLRATIIQPAPTQTLPQNPTAPCSLVVMPAGDYTQVDVQDQDGLLIATTAQTRS